LKNLKQTKGKLKLNIIENITHFKGDKAFFKGKPAPDGRYKIGFLRYVIIKNGEVEKTSSFGLPD